MDTLHIIPNEVYYEQFIQYFTIKEIANLIMTSKLLKSIFDTNDIWKILHFKTTPLKILKTSIHIGSSYSRSIARIDSPDEIMLLSKFNRIASYIKKENLYNGWPTIEATHRLRIDTGISIINIKDFIPTPVISYDEPPKGWEFVSLKSKANDCFHFQQFDSIYENPGCISKSNSVLSLFTWSVRSNISINLSNICIIDQSLSIQKEYSDYLASLGHVKCSCVNHYDITTLSNSGLKINYKSYKKMTLKKLHTQSKKNIKPSEKKMNKKDIQIQKAKQILEKLESEKKSLIEQNKKCIIATSKLKEAIELL